MQPHHLLDAIPGNVALLDENGIIVHVNQGWLHFAAENGLNETVLGQCYLRVCDEGLADRLREVLSGAVEELDYEYPCHSPTQYRWFRMQARPVPSGAVLVHTNITDRVIGEATMEQAAVGIAHLNLDGTFIRANARLCEILGYSHEELVGVHATEITMPEDLERSHVALANLKSGEVPQVSFEKRYRRRDGTPIWCQVLATRTNHRFILSVLQDITRRKTAEARLHRLNRLYAMQGAVNESLLKSDPTQFADEVCRIMRDVGGMRGAQVQATEGPVSFPLQVEGRPAGYLVLDCDPPEEDELRLLEAVARSLSYALDKAALEVRLQHLVDSTQDLLWVMDERNRVSYINAAAREIFGREPAEMIGHKLKEFVEPEQMAHDRAIVLDGAEHGLSQVTYDSRVPHIDGPLVYLQTKARLLYAKDGSLCGLVGSSRNVTLDRMAQDALEKSERLFRTLTETIPQIAFRSDGQRNCFYLNSRWEEYTGQPAEEALGHGWMKAFHPDDDIALDGQIRPFERENRLRRPDGGWRWVLVRAVPLFAEEGAHLGWVGTMTDIDDLRRAQERSRLLAEATSDAVWDWNVETGDIWFSEGYTKLFGYPAGDLQLEDFRQHISPADRTRIIREVDECLAGGEVDWHNEFYFQRSDGTQAYVQERGRVHRDKAGKPVRMVGGITDLTDRKLLEEQFLRVQRMESIGTLAGGIAHDLNNVLTPVMMSIELLRHEEKDGERLDILDAIESSARRGANLVRQVLSYARGLEGQRVEVQLKHILRDLEKFANDTFLKQIHVRLSIHGDLKPVTGDPTQLQQAFLNLLVNARDAMSRGGTLTLDATSAEVKGKDYIAVSVQDTGEGMEEHVLKRIFDPFFTTRDLGQGTGLGLSTALAIVRGHDGFIRVESQPGVGSKFSVYLPAAVPAAAEVPAQDAVVRSEGQTILVVDDEPPIRLLTAHTLKAHGYRVLQASDGAEAVAIYAREEGKVDLVITDMMMPIMDGAATIQVLKRINPEVRIIAVSGLMAEPPEQVRHFLAKPYSGDLLLRTVQKALTD